MLWTLRLLIYHVYIAVMLDVGVQWHEAYAAVNEHGRMMVGGRETLLSPAMVLVTFHANDTADRSS